jgi:hypothetical protein
MKNFSLALICLFGAFILSVSAMAQISELDAGLGDSYYYVDHFEIIIDKPLSDVWPHVIAMGKWMPWMASKDSPNEIASEGQKVNLYGDFYIEVVKVIPQKMILLTNLPGVERGEQSQGIAMVSVIEINGKTLVSIFMSRIYNWFEPTENPQREIRESTDFAKQRKATFKDNFLEKLKQLSED